MTAPTRPYRYRNLPCSLRGGLHGKLTHATHSIGGRDLETGAGGVLEWCYSQEDAAEMLREMQGHTERFMNLSIQRER